MSISVEVLKEFLILELEILQRENGMSAEEAQKFHQRLVSSQVNFATLNLAQWNRYPNSQIITANEASGMEYLETKIIRLQSHLKRFLEPVKQLAPSTELKVNDVQRSKNDQPATANLNSLIQKREFYIKMIGSLVPEGGISPRRAELQYEHVSQIYERFVTNQSEIMTIVKDAEIDDQVKLSKVVQSNVLAIQETLKEVFSPMKPVVLPESKMNERFSRIRIDDALNISENIVWGSTNEALKSHSGYFINDPEDKHALSNFLSKLRNL